MLRICGVIFLSRLNAGKKNKVGRYENNTDE
jgi:hypothetical protein